MIIQATDLLLQVGFFSVGMRFASAGLSYQTLMDMIGQLQVLIPLHTIMDILRDIMMDGIVLVMERPSNQRPMVWEG